MSDKRKIAALCVARNSIYKTMPGVDAWDIDRGVINFPGDRPVVCHPPCRAWSAFCAHQAKPPAGEKELAPLCVGLMRSCGGILEHPAHSRLWTYMNLPLPGELPRNGWWSLAVKQCWWGDVRTKATWLLFSGVDPAIVSTPFRLHNPSSDKARWNKMSKNQRAATPIAFAEWLVDLSRRSSMAISA